MLTFFIQDSGDKHIPSKTSRSVSSIPWITPEISRNIRRKNRTHAKAKKTGSSKLRSKFETLRREIKADVRKQHDLCVLRLNVPVNNFLVMSGRMHDLYRCVSLILYLCDFFISHYIPSRVFPHRLHDT